MGFCLHGRRTGEHPLRSQQASGRSCHGV